MTASQLLFSFHGRLNRKPYWLMTLVLLVILVATFVVAFIVAGGAAALDGDMSGMGAALILLAVVYIPLLWIGLANSAKRLHDRDKSGLWLLLFWFAPAILDRMGERIEGFGIVFTLVGLAISVWALIEVGFLRGTAGPNRYGPDPLATS